MKISAIMDKISCCCCHCCSVAKSCLTLCNPMDCSKLGSSVLHYLLEFAQIHVHWVGNVIQPSHPLSSLLLLPSIFPNIRVFSNESVLCIRWPKYWSFSFSISSSNEYSGLISFRIDWFDVCAVQGTLKSLLQHHSWKTSVLQCSAFFMVQHSYPYMTIGKTTALTRWTFVRKVMALILNILSRFVIAFLPRSKPLLNFMAAVTFYSDLGDQENKVCHCVLIFLFYLPWSDGTGCHDLSFFNVEFQASFSHSLLSPSSVPLVRLHFLS